MTEVILDGEIMAFEHGKKLTFFDLQKRLGTKKRGGRSVCRCRRPMCRWFLWPSIYSGSTGDHCSKRRCVSGANCFRSLTMPAEFQIAEISPARSAEEIEAAFQMARRRLNEGLMIKDPESQYTPGRRGMSWFKLKKELATLDVVVVAAEVGPWQTQPCVKRLHLRRARRRDWEASADRKSLQWPNGC